MTVRDQWIQLVMELHKPCLSPTCGTSIAIKRGLWEWAGLNFHEASPYPLQDLWPLLEAEQALAAIEAQDREMGALAQGVCHGCGRRSYTEGPAEEISCYWCGRGVRAYFRKPV